VRVGGVFVVEDDGEGYWDMLLLLLLLTRLAR
jgi:hypothetical protein